MPITYTKDRAYRTLAANGINDVLLHFTNRDAYGQKRFKRQWTASRGAGKEAKRLAEGRHLIEIVRELIADEHHRLGYEDLLINQIGVPTGNANNARALGDESVSGGA